MQREPDEYVDIAEASIRFSDLVSRAARGEGVEITRDGKPTIRLVPCAARRSKRVLGIWGGKVRMADGFDAPLRDDDLDSWTGKT